MSNLSPSTLALLRAAKNDAPSKESRTAIWGGVTSGLVTHTPLHITPQAAGSSAAPGASTSIAPSAVGGAGAAATAKGGMLVGSSLTGMKGAFIGALFGSAISIGVAAFMMRAKPADVSHAPTSAQAATQIGDAKSGGASSIANPKSASSDSNASNNANAIELGATPTTNSASAGSTVNSAGSSVFGSDSKSSNASSSSNARSMTDNAQSLRSKKSATTDDSTSLDDDMLTRESSLVAEAHGDELKGDFAGALKAVRAARSLERRQFEPNEMAIEARALRGLGRDDEAAKIESKLRAMYPNQLL